MFASIRALQNACIGTSNIVLFQSKVTKCCARSARYKSRKEFVLWETTKNLENFDLFSDLRSFNHRTGTFCLHVRPDDNKIRFASGIFFIIILLN